MNDFPVPTISQVVVRSYTDFGQIYFRCDENMECTLGYGSWSCVFIGQL